MRDLEHARRWLLRGAVVVLPLYLAGLFVATSLPHDATLPLPWHAAAAGAHPRTDLLLNALAACVTLGVYLVFTLALAVHWRRRRRRVVP